jgi:hypothetical protein
MKLISKTILGVAVAGLVAASSFAPAEAARWRHAGPVAAGVIGGLALGSALASAPFYGSGYYGYGPAYGYEYGYGPRYYGNSFGGDRLHNDVGNF